MGEENNLSPHYTLVASCLNVKDASLSLDLNVKTVINVMVGSHVFSNDVLFSIQIS